MIHGVMYWTDAWGIGHVAPITIEDFENENFSFTRYMGRNTSVFIVP